MPPGVPPAGAPYPTDPGGPAAPPPGGPTGTGSAGPHGGGGQLYAMTLAFTAHPVRFLYNNPNRNRVRFAQQFLRSKGYHVTIDGQLGPQTLAAAKRFHLGLRPGQKLPSGNGHHRGGGGGAPPIDTSPLPTPPLPGAATDLRGFSVIDPRRYARNLTNVQYGPVLAALMRQIGQQQTQGVTNLANIGKWYSDAADVAKSGAAADVAQAAASQQAADEFRRNIAAATGGGSAAAGVGAYADITSQGQRQLAENIAAADQARQSNVATQGAFTRTSQQRADEAALSQLQGTRRDTLAQRGQAFGANLMQAIQLHDQQLAARQAMALSGYNAQLTGEQAGLSLRSTQLQNQGLAAQLQKAGVTGKGVSVLKDPQQSLQLSDLLDKKLWARPADGKILTPREAWAQMTTYLRTATGHIPRSNRQVFNWGRTYYRHYVGQYVAFWNRHHDASNQVSIDHFLSDNGTPWSSADWRQRGVSWA